MKYFYCDHFAFPLPDNHRFPLWKYSLLRQQLLELGVAGATDLHVSDPVTREELERAHAPEYVQRVIDGLLTDSEVRRIGLPWSPELVERALRSAGGTVAASRAALEEGTAMNLAGSTHHASRDGGEGFCLFNDSAVAARAVQADGFAARVAVVDCDVHQGNGTASIFADDPSVFTFSVHGAKNFPFRKEPSDLDIELGDGARDDEYLAAVERGLRIVLARHRPDLVIYVSGADPLHGDRFGRLSVSRGGLAMRDRMVFETMAEAGVPVTVVLAGGYAPDIRETVAVHVETARAAARAAARYGATTTRSRDTA